MNRSNSLLVFITISSFMVSNLFGSAVANWSDMKLQYLNIYKNLEPRMLQREKEYCGHFWAPRKEQFKRLLLGNLNTNLWKQNPVFETMVRAGFGLPQEFEVCFLKTCLSKQVSALISSYRDTNFNGMPFECRELNCSTNTLGHLFYCAKILEVAENNKKNLENIVEFGAGFGNLTRIFKSLLPHSTIINIDLPEFLALQYFFIRSTLPGATVIVHSKIPSHFQKNAVHLVPVFLVPEMNIQADLFVSTFGLTESPHITQNLIASKQFFNAEITYITGQLHGWGQSFKMEDHAFLHNAVRSNYVKVQCQPFHIFFQTLKSYEMIGIVKR